MDKQTFKFWISRSRELEEDRNKWVAIAKRLANPVHDANCEFAVKCSYCDAIEAVKGMR